MITATYSPDDNRIRLTSSTRLDTDTYTRVKSAGFKWAPKLQQFIAPCWTPEREDVALELSTYHEIEDEDTSLLERAETRAERFDTYSEKRGIEADAAHAAVDRVARRFEGGQPIILAHHSTKRALRDKEKIESGMRKAVNLWKTSEYWKDRAEGAIRHAKYVERPDVRARRIKGLEADQRKITRDKTEAELWLRTWENIDTIKLTRKDENGVPQPTTLIEKARYIAGRCNLYVVNTDENGCRWTCRWTAWDVLRPDGERYNACPAYTVEQVQQAAREAYPKTIAWCDRWLTHYENRLTYERAMLAESGGFVIARKVKAKTALPLLNYSGQVTWRSRYGTDDIVSETVPMTKAEYASINVDYKGTSVSADGTHRLRTAMQRGKLFVVYLTDSKQHPRPSSEDVEAKKVEESAQKQMEMENKLRNMRLAQEEHTAQSMNQLADARTESFKRLEQQSKTGVQVVVADQLFVTPSEIAARMVELANLRASNRVGELSAGTGNIVKAVITHGDAHDTNYEIVMVEIAPKLCDLLRATFPGRQVVCADFLMCSAESVGIDGIHNGLKRIGRFDRIIINPPFANGQDIAHIKHALSLLRVGGVLVALCANGPRQQKELMPLVLKSGGTWKTLPVNSFKESGTGVSVAMLTIYK